ncbi:MULTISPECIES: thermonuclease family protein [unclassified Shinella]|uniref:thermonuclease family protein n=1 Tax=unclassified Shinella TaxID=2643062 RepID=UPI00234F8340|nr:MULTISPECIES: thermonuclease family protein [unclassified Shinella]MCO5154002.1 thermonuclease family protein [Shinella sp.]MDC7266921.1 thermonuclease family protein [Shinella sp. HY16]MDC7273818.1 thermonuclease family protein [Shinella sp. YZ44]
MTAPRGIVISAAFAAAVLSALWIASDDRFGRPAEFPRADRSREKFKITPPPRIDMLEATFKICDCPIRGTCVVDGDTFWFKGDKIRIADIDAPEISSPLCEDEKHVGEIARDRPLALLNDGGFSLQPGRRDVDRYGRKLRTVTRADRSLDGQLVEEGRARRRSETDCDWCAQD